MTDKTHSDSEEIKDLELGDEDARNVTGGVTIDGYEVSDGTSNTAGLKAGASEV